MRLNYSKMTNAQLGRELCRYINDEVEETRENARKFDFLVREITKRLMSPETNESGDKAVAGYRKRRPDDWKERRKIRKDARAD